MGNIFSKGNFLLSIPNDFWVASNDYKLTDEYARTFCLPEPNVSPNPAAFNNYTYELTGSTLSDSDFKSGASEPAFAPTDPNDTVHRDNNIEWRPWYAGTCPQGVWQANHTYTYYDKICASSDPTGAYATYYLWHKYVTSGSSQPSWPTTDGQTVSDGQITWTARKIFNSLDYNVYQTGGRGIVVGINTRLWTTDLATWQGSPYNMEPHSIQGDPKFVKLSTGINDPGNWQLQNNSPAKNAFPTAQAPISLFTSDILGTSRPQGSAWDMGAYEYSEAGDTTPPAAPTGLAVN
jgi:hypothetical protein